MATGTPEESLTEPAEVLQTRAAGDLPLEQDTQPPCQRRLVDDEVQLDPGADSAGVVASRAPLPDASRRRCQAGRLARTTTTTLL